LGGLNVGGEDSKIAAFLKLKFSITQLERSSQRHPCIIYPHGKKPRDTRLASGGRQYFYANKLTIGRQALIY
jgi:hypothetical protein